MTKTALVTGGAHRLGRQIALFLAKEGYELALIYNSASDEELEKTKLLFKPFKTRTEVYKCNLMDLAETEKTISQIGADFGKIDVLVNNSGIIKKVEFEELSPELFDATIAVNLRAPLFVSQYCLKFLNKSESPVIIIMASLGGMQNWTGYMPYSISKTAVIKLTYLLARKLAPKIRVNAIAPGTIIVENEEQGIPEKTNIEKIPLKRYGKSENIVSAVKYILENDYVTGQVLAVEGGRLLNS